MSWSSPWLYVVILVLVCHVGRGGKRMFASLSDYNYMSLVGKIAKTGKGMILCPVGRTNNCNAA